MAHHNHRGRQGSLVLLACFAITVAAGLSTNNGIQSEPYRRRLLADRKYKLNDPVPLYAAKVGLCNLALVVEMIICITQQRTCSTHCTDQEYLPLHSLTTGGTVCQSQVRGRTHINAYRSLCDCICTINGLCASAARHTSTTSCPTASQQMGCGTRHWAWER